MIILNGKPIKSFIFPGGESHVNLGDPITLSRENLQFITAGLYNANDIMCLLLTVDAVKRRNPYDDIELTIPYFPYGRQDRVCEEGESLSVRVMADLINGLKCKRVIIYDPHSDVVGALVNNCKIIPGFDLMQSSFEIMSCFQHCSIVCPDAGAEKKLKKLEHIKPLIYCRKARDTKTGKITDLSIQGDVQGENLFLIDDICDGGATFIELAKILKAKGALKLYLYVTHGIFSRGLDELMQYFERIFCFHSFTEKNSKFLRIIGG